MKNPLLTLAILIFFFSSCKAQTYAFAPVATGTQAIHLYANPLQTGQALVKGLIVPSIITVFNIPGEVVLHKRSNGEGIVIALEGQSGHYMPLLTNRILLS